MSTGELNIGRDSNVLLLGCERKRICKNELVLKFRGTFVSFLFVYKKIMTHVCRADVRRCSLHHCVVLATVRAPWQLCAHPDRLARLMGARKQGSFSFLIGQGSFSFLIGHSCTL